MFKRMTIGEWVCLIMIILIVGLCITSVIVGNVDKRTITLTVTDKAVKNSGEDGKYLVYCKDSEDKVHVMEVTDTLLRVRFTSSDEYAGIEVGKTYEFTVVGKRIPILSMYPNILSHKEVE